MPTTFAFEQACTCCFITFSHEQNGQVPKHLNLIWRDPLAVLYLTPVPKELELRYGIEITFLKTGGKPSSNGGTATLIDETRDQVVEIVGYDETRFFRHMNAKPPSSVTGHSIQIESDPHHLNVPGFVQNQRRNTRSTHNWQHDIESGSICSYSILGGGDGSISNLEESFTYRVMHSITF